eukprot:scaffold741_cov336-Pavlova_lutheri.AAC.11
MAMSVDEAKAPEEDPGTQEGEVEDQEGPQEETEGDEPTGKDEGDTPKASRAGPSEDGEGRGHKESTVKRTGSGPRRGVDVFAIPAVENIYHRSSVLTRDGRRVREACRKYLGTSNSTRHSSKNPPLLLTNVAHASFEAEAESKTTTPRQDATSLERDAQERTSRLLQPLLICCECGNTRAVESALSCLHKIISLGFLSGETQMDGGLKEEDSLTSIIKVTSLVASSNESKQVQLSVVRLLLSAVTSRTFILHGACLLEAVRTVYNIHLIGDDDIKRAAQGALEQIVGTLLQRTCVPEQYRPRKAGAECPYSATTSVAQSEELSVDLTVSPTGLIRIQLQDGSACERVPQEFDPPVPGTPTHKEQELVGDSLPSVEKKSSRGQHSTPPIESEEESMTFPDEEEVNELSERLSSLAEKGDVKAMESVLNDTPQPGEERAPSRPPLPESAELFLAMPESKFSPFERDALLVLRALCMLASRESGLTQVDQDMLGSKCLSLEMLCKTLASGFDLEHDPAGRSTLTTYPFTWENASRSFINALQRPLSICLLRNCLSQQGPVSELVADLFGILLRRPCLRAEMRTELGAFYPLIILKPLENPGSVACQQEAALKLLLHIGQEPQLLVDIFVNFDCELHAMNLYERTVNALAIFLRRNTYTQSVSQKQDDICTTALLSISWIIKGFSKHILALKEEPADSAGTSLAESDDGISDGVRTENVSAMKSKKFTVESCIESFNKNPFKGIKNLLECGIITENSASEIAKFLLRTPGLDKSALGEYLGHHGEIEIATMHSYIDMFDFSGTGIDEGIRILLSGFRLPGEAQKIDRIMEKFAERYCATNPGVFKDADEAYILSYAIIILNTDAHNPMVKNRMTKEEFISMAGLVDKSRGSDDSDDAVARTRSLLSGIYDRITSKEIQLKGSDADQSNTSSQRNASQQSVLISLIGLGRDQDSALEREKLIEAARESIEESMKGAGGPKNTWQTIKNSSTVEPMFELCGDSLLECLRIGLKSRKSANIDIAAESHESLLALAHHLGLPRIQENCIKSLCDTAHLSFLTPNVNAYTYQGLVGKKAASILLKAAGREGDAIGHSWLNVLRTISRMEDLRIFCSGEATDGSYFAAERQKSAPEHTSTLSKLLGRKENVGHPLVKSIGHLPDFLKSENGALMLERVFSQSSLLSADSILEFMFALCTVSAEELSITPPTGPRVFSLQKLVEAAHVNLERIRFVWSRLWSKVGPHLASAGCHGNEEVAIYAVDSLRQLGAKILEREELSHYRFQSDALRPFSYILRHSKSIKVKEFAVQCLMQLAGAFASRLQSGWDSIWSALSIACSDSAENVAVSALDAAEGILLSLYHQDLRMESFTDMVNCGSSVASNENLPADTRQRGVFFLGSCGKLLGKLSEVLLSEGGKGDQVHSQLWLPLAVALSDLCRPPNPPMLKTVAAEVFFGDLILSFGHLFTAVLWNRLIERVFLPLFLDAPSVKLQDHATHMGVEEGSQASDEHDSENDSSNSTAKMWWLEITSSTCLVPMCRVAGHFPVGCASLLSPLRDIMVRCATSFGSSTARNVVAGVNEFAERAPECNWQMVVETYALCLEGNQESGLRSEITTLFQEALARLCKEHWAEIPGDYRVKMLDALKSSATCASDYTRNYLILRNESEGIDEPLQDTNLLGGFWSQEVEGSIFYIRCLETGVQMDESGSSKQDLLEFCYDVLVRQTAHLAVDRSAISPAIASIQEQYLSQLARVLLEVLEIYKGLDEVVFKGEVRRVAPEVFKLTCSSQPAIRKSVGELLSEQVTPLLCKLPSQFT